MCASCGNMSSAVAPVAAKAGIKCFVILSSEATNSNKLAMQYTGAEIFEFEGRFDEIDNLIADFSSQNPEIPCINTNLQKIYMQGLKSLYYELFDDLATKHQNVNIIVPTADGTLIHALHLAYLDYKNEFSEISFNPCFIIAQPQNCSPIVKSFHNNSKIMQWNENTKTSVLSLSVDYPLLNGENALIAVKETKGTSIAVSENDIIQNCKLLAEKEGIFTDDVGGIVIGALKQLKDKNLLNDFATVCLLTGNGLKTVEKFYNSYSIQNEKYSSVSEFLNQIKKN
jgi:threonine synthase